MLASDSILVPAYLERKIKFSDISDVLEKVFLKYDLSGSYDLADVLRINDDVEKYTEMVVQKL